MLDTVRLIDTLTKLMETARYNGDDELYEKAREKLLFCLSIIKEVEL